MTRIAINGLGRIGRATLKVLIEDDAFEIAAVNDLVDASDLAYLLNFDSVYGRYDRPCAARNGKLAVGEAELPAFHDKDPAQLPWADLGVDIVFECTGALRDKASLEKHLHGGARRVILSAPPKGDGIPTVVPGVNQLNADEPLRSCASCTTNCIAPIVEIVDRRIGVQKAAMTTIHAYTASQHIVDGPSSKRRRGRAAAVNLVPTSTGAAKATGEAYAQIQGRFDGAAVRAPVPVGSISDITFVLKQSVTVDEANRIFADEADTDRYRGVVGVSDQEMVSSDIVNDPRASVVDQPMTQVIDGDLLKVMSWYDNEWGYSNQMVREARAMAHRREAAAV